MADAAQQQLQQSTRELTQALRMLANQSSQTAAATQANYQKYLTLNDELEDHRTQIIKGRTLTKQQQKLDEEMLAAKRKELHLLKEYQKAQESANEIANNTNKSELEKSEAAKHAQKALRRFEAAQGETVAATKELEDSLSGLTKGVNLAGMAMVWFGTTVKNAAFQARDQVVANQGMVSGTGSLIDALKQQQDEALSLGLSGSEYAGIINESRQMVNAMGGASMATKEAESSLVSFYTMTGDSKKAYEALIQTMGTFAAKGITPTQQVLEGYAQDVKTLGMQTGMNEAQARQYYEDIASDADSIDLLRSARKEERAAILASQRAMVQQAIAVGMTAEQAKEATKMLNKMVDAKPLDRLRQAAKIRALSGALGIAGGNEAADALIAGKRATAVQKQAIMQFGQNAANAMDQAARQGFGSEIVASQLMDKLDLDQYYGKGSPFSTTLGDKLANPIKELQASTVDASKSQLAKLAYLADKAARQAELLTGGNHYLGVLVSTVELIAAMVIGGKLVSFGKNLLGEVAGKLGLRGAAAGAAGEAAAVGEGVAAGAGGATEGATGAAEGVAGAAEGTSTAVTALSTLSKAAKILGPLATVGAGVYEGYQSYKENGRTGEAVGTGVGTAAGGLAGGWAGAGAGAAAGAFVGSIVPVIGTAVGAAVGGVFGGLGGGLFGARGGGKVGKAVGGKFDPEGKPVVPNPAADEKDPAVEVAKRTADSNASIMTAVTSTADGIAAQLKKMDQQNTTLQSIADMTQRVIELNEKQLIALTMTEKERTDTNTRKTLRRNNKFGSQYNYV